MTLPCQSGDPDRFFPGRNWSTDQLNAVKAECSPCPQIETRLKWALVHGEQGIWAGTTDEDRKAIRYRQHIAIQRVHGPRAPDLGRVAS